MKRFLFFLFLLPLGVHAQQFPTTLEGWSERLKSFGEKIPQEELFLHMDNSCYYLGDTLYFKAYMRLSDGRPSNLSNLLYVELLNQDGYLVERQKVEMKQGMGNGSFCLLDTLYGGYYELRAYTRWQLNWGLYEHAHTKNAEKWFLSNKMMHEYYRDYDKLYSRVFPVYDHPRQPGDYAQDMTTRPMRRQFKQKEEKPRAVVMLYPEGGNLVEGVPNRIAFEANDENGKHLKGKLKIKNERLKKEAEAETKNRGRGVISIDEMGNNCTFEWEGGQVEVPLPKPVTDGVAIQASVETDGIHVALYPHGSAAAEPLGLTASCHGVQKHFEQVDGKDEVVIPLSVLPTGIIQLSVFNAEGRIYADRLVFVRQPDFLPQNLTFSGMKTHYEPYEKVSFDVKCKMVNGNSQSIGQLDNLQLDNSQSSEPQNLTTSNSQFSILNSQSSISLAVRDAAHSDYTFDSGNIMTEMLLASQIKGFVEQPEYFFEADDEEHRQALDLLLMVQGWRRYDWVEMATPGAFTLIHPYERTEILLGEVSKYDAEVQHNAIMEAMDQHDREYEQDQAYLSSRSATLQGEDQSQFSEAEAGTQTISEMANDQGARFEADETRQGTTQKTNANAADQRNRWRYNLKDNHGALSQEALVHAEFIQPGVQKDKSMVMGDMDTYDGGLFRIEAPRFYDSCLLSYAAVAKNKWKGEQHIWIDTNEDKNGRINYPDFYVKLTPVYPRFPKPYNFYQQTAPTARKQGGKRLWVGDEAILMNEVTIGARRNGFRRFDALKPAFVLDAYEAFNDVCDAGFCPGYYIGANRFAMDIARTYIGDMNQERAYNMEQRFDTKNSSSLLSPGLLEKYDHLPNLDMVYVYTDYSPRQEGDERYSGDNQPIVTVDLRRFADESQRMTWRDRHMVLRGYAVCEDFYQPDYSNQKPTEPTDYRRTLYWNPDVQLDSEGRATIQFYNNSQKTQITVSAEGMTSEGVPLTGISYPEDR